MQATIKNRTTGLKQAETRDLAGLLVVFRNGFVAASWGITTKMTNRPHQLVIYHA